MDEIRLKTPKTATGYMEVHTISMANHGQGPEARKRKRSSRVREVWETEEGFTNGMNEEQTTGNALFGFSGVASVSQSDHFKSQKQKRTDIME